MIGQATVNFQPEESCEVRVYDVTYREDRDGAWLARIAPRSVIRVAVVFTGAALTAFFAWRYWF